MHLFGSQNVESLDKTPQTSAWLVVGSDEKLCSAFRKLYHKYLRAMEEESSPASLGQTNLRIVHHDDQMYDLPELLTAR